MNVITFIIRVLKLLHMQGKYILFALIVILLLSSPVSAVTNKIAAGAPVFVGESNLNIASAIGDCHVIAWWPDGNNMTGPAAKNLTLKRLNEANDLVTSFNVSPQVFTSYTGNWYCEDKKPSFVVLTVVEPNLSIRVWDVDTDKDISGQSVPASTNITYRIDTNLYQAMSYNNRIDLNPSDNIFSIRLMTPSGKQLNNIYTGSVGASTTQILIFDSNPFITTPVYLGRNLDSWNHLARDASGGYLYPAGTYTFTVTQNLNQMQGLYQSEGINTTDGITTSSARVTFLPQGELTQVSVTPQETIVPTSETSVPPVTVKQPTVSVPVSTATPVATKTTYSPLPWWIAAMGLLAAIFILQTRK